MMGPTHCISAKCGTWPLNTKFFFWLELSQWEVFTILTGHPVANQPKGPYIKDVRTGRGRGVAQKQT